MEIYKQLDIISDLPDNWDREGGKKVNPEIIKSAKKFLDVLYLCRRPGSCGFLNCQADDDGWPGDPIPHDIYPLNDGNLMLEWQYPTGEIERIEIEQPGTGELMRTFPGKANIEAEFRTIHW